MTELIVKVKSPGLVSVGYEGAKCPIVLISRMAPIPDQKTGRPYMVLPIHVTLTSVFKRLQELPHGPYEQVRDAVLKIVKDEPFSPDPRLGDQGTARTSATPVSGAFNVVITHPSLTAMTRKGKK